LALGQNQPKQHLGSRKFSGSFFAFKQLAASNWQLAKQKQPQKQKERLLVLGYWPLAEPKIKTKGKKPKSQNLTADCADQKDLHGFFGVVFLTVFA
jgi:hypothetical protein